MTDHADTLKSLHTALIDSRAGYEEALKDAEGRGLTELFREMIALRTSHAERLAEYLRQLGESVDEKGSFMSTVHRTVISIRSLFGELDEKILPGLIDGEERILGYYDEALQASPASAPETAELASQRGELTERIEEMRARLPMAA